MGRYTGPVEKLERREGVWLDFKGKRQLLGKADHESLAGRVLRLPVREEIAMPVTEQLVIERYARR